MTCLDPVWSPSREPLPSKLKNKLAKLQGAVPKYKVEEIGVNTYKVSYKLASGFVDEHIVRLELHADGTPLWLTLCSCGKPWVRRYPCIHVVTVLSSTWVRPYVDAHSADFGWFQVGLGQDLVVCITPHTAGRGTRSPSTTTAGLLMDCIVCT